jgi:hypothetical protein
VPWFSAQCRLSLALIGLGGKAWTRDVGTGILALWLRRIERQMIMSFVRHTFGSFSETGRSCRRYGPRVRRGGASSKGLSGRAGEEHSLDNMAGDL